MTDYEVMFIIEPTLEDTAKEAMIETVKGIITADAGEIKKVDLRGMKKLAYPIRKKNEGYYVVIEFSGLSKLPKELNRRLKISDNILRHMISKKDA